jgi:hypothetical protein
MKRKLVWFLGLGLPAGLLAAGLASYPAVENRVLAVADTVARIAPKLPLRKIVLFSSGVGFFQREGEVDGDARIDLTFPAGDVNDLLKSLTVQDLGGGRIQAVGYDSHDPIDRTLRSFAINLADNPGQADILDRARGEKVEVNLTTGGTPVVGSILGVERQEQVIKEATVKVELLNLFTSDGMRSLKLSEVARVRFLNPTLEAELKRALETLSLSRDTQKKAVTLKFAGAGKRPVRVSYVVENPIWKTSYRLVLDKDGKPFLQGWAVVENPTDEDWSDVRMALVSGRPISFKMDLYSPLYVPRPVVEPELFSSLRPPSYDGLMDRKDMERQARAEPAVAAPMMGVLGDMPGPAAKTRAPADRAGRPGGALGFSAENKLQERLKQADKGRDDFDPTQGVASAAMGAQLGDFFQYTLEDPVSVGRQKSSLLPIVNQAVDGSRVSIYNARTHAKYPLLGLRFKNATNLSLMQGPVTVFDGPSYAGDARLPDLQAGEERLLSYAIDLGTEVESQLKSPAAEIATLKLVKGVLHTTRKVREERTYKAVNRSKTDRTLLIEHPYRAEYRLTGSAKPAERTRDLYRFELKLPAGGSGTAEVREERDLEQTIALLGASEDQIRFYLRTPAITPAVRQALEEAISLRGKLAQAQRELADVTRQLADIVKDQERLRANLKELPPTAAAYKRYLEKFDQQETQVEKLQTDQKRLQDVEAAARARLEQYLQNLNAE